MAEPVAVRLRIASAVSSVFSYNNIYPSTSLCNFGPYHLEINRKQTIRELHHDGDDGGGVTCRSNLQGRRGRPDLGSS